MLDDDSDYGATVSGLTDHDRTQIPQPAVAAEAAAKTQTRTHDTPTTGSQRGAEEGRLGVSCTLCACGMCEFFIKIQVTSKGLTGTKGDARGSEREVGVEKRRFSLVCICMCVCRCR